MSRKHPERRPHPDPRVELQLQRIIGYQRAIRRYETLIGEYRNQMAATSIEQDNAGYALRNYGDYDKADFSQAMTASEQRMKAAQDGIYTAEQAIEAQHELISKLAGELSDTDLSYL